MLKLTPQESKLLEILLDEQLEQDIDGYHRTIYSNIREKITQEVYD